MPIQPLFARGLSILLLVTVADRASSDWTRFRGPNGSGIAESSVPTRFGADENLLWKRELPGRGVSSPIVVGDKVFVTCYSGYGMGDNAGELEDLKRHLVCVSVTTGETLWTKTVAAKMPEDPYRPPGVTTHGYASNTPASDGEAVYAFFGKSGLYAFDMEGNELWNRSVGAEPSFKGFGSAASPIVNDTHVIVNAADESLSIVWLDKQSGEESFRAEADGLGECWTTPVLVDNNGNSEIAISVIGEIWGLSNTTGKLRWYAAGVNSRNAQVSVIVDDAGVVYAVGEEGVAVRVDGKGDLTDDNTVWEGRIRTSYATPVLVGGHLFSVSGTVVECVDASTGERVFQERLSRGSSVAPAETDENVRGGDRFAGGDRSRFGGGAGGPGGFSGRGGFGSRGGFGGGRGGRGGGGDYASPVVAGDKIYITTNAGVIYVIAATPEFQQLAANDLSADASGFGGTPAVSDGRLFLRSNTHLYCIGSN